MTAFGPIADRAGGSSEGVVVYQRVNTHTR